MLLLAMTALFATSCDKDEELDTENPKIIWKQPQFGETIAANEDIIVDFSDNVGLATASIAIATVDGMGVDAVNGNLSGTSGTITWSNNGNTLQTGDYTLTATVTDEAGNTNTGSNQFSVN